MAINFTQKIKNLFFRFYFFVLRIVGFITGRHFVMNRFKVAKPDFAQREIAKKTIIKSGLTSFPLRPSLEIKKDIQHLRIHTEAWDKYTEFEQFLNEKIDLDFSKIVLADGSEPDLKVRLIDVEEKNHDLKFIWTPYAIVYQERLPKARKFVELRIFSDKQFEAYKIDFVDLSEETAEK
jgi:hypothetical protein